jgi:membrane-bound lytic murein transglycosylase D
MISSTMWKSARSLVCARTLATCAAARYLGSLYPRLKEWRLTLAAYNWGQGNVRRLLEKQRAATFDASAVHLPAETQMYVPKIDAVLKRRERTGLAQLPAPSR